MVIAILFIFLQNPQEGVLGLSWVFSLPLRDVIAGTAVDYMHCISEGAVNQHLMAWFEDKSNECYLGSSVNEIDSTPCYLLSPHQKLHADLEVSLTGNSGRVSKQHIVLKGFRTNVKIRSYKLSEIFGANQHIRCRCVHILVHVKGP